MDTVDIKTYMQAVGREARAASRMMARVLQPSDETKRNYWLLTTLIWWQQRSRDSIQP